MSKAKHFRTLQLRIICKTQMFGGFCYLGVDEIESRLLRPVYNISKEACCWPSDYQIRVGMLIEFQVIYHPDDILSCPTAFPHRNEDLLVTPYIVIIYENFISLPTSLLTLCNNNVFQIFPEEVIRDNRYVVENVNCPSAGILIMEQRNVRVYTDKWGKQRVQIRYRKRNRHYTYDFRLTAVNFYIPQQSGHCIVVLGLGRPYTGNIPNVKQFSPARCYILAIGILALPV